MLYQFLWDDVARKQIKPEQLKQMQKRGEVEYIEDRQGNPNIKNKSHLIRTLSSKAPKTKAAPDHIRMQTLRTVDEGQSSPTTSTFSPPTTFGAIIEKEPASATDTDNKRLTM